MEAKGNGQPNQPLAPAAPLAPLSNEERLRDVRRYESLKFEKEEAFDRLLAITTQAVSAPIGFFSFVSSDEQVFKSVYGVTGTAMTEALFAGMKLPLKRSLCRNVVEAGRPLAIRDLKTHAVPSEAEGLLKTGIRAYLGLPLVSGDGNIIGSFCVLDLRVREWSDRDIKLVFEASALAMRQIELLEVERANRHRLRILEVSQTASDQKVAAMAASMDGMAVLNPDERYIFMNRAHARTYGYDDPAELIGKSWRTLYAPEEVARFEQDIMPELRRTGSWRGEATGRRKSGALFAQEISLSSIEHGGLVCVVRDISRRRRAEKFENFLANATMLLTQSLDPQSTIDNLARLPVPEISDWCAVSIRDTAGRNEFSLHHRDPVKREAVKNLVTQSSFHKNGDPAFWRPLRAQQPVLVPEVTVEAMRELGWQSEVIDLFTREKVVSFLSVPLVVRNRTLGAISLAETAESNRNFTRQDLLLASEIGRRAALAIDNALLYNEAKEAAEAHEELIAIVSHDLKNPLNAILINAGLLSRHFQTPDSDPKSRKQVHLIRHAADRMNRLIRDLLDLNKIRGGRMVPEKSRHSARKLLQDSVDLLLPMLQEKSLHLNMEDVPADLHVHCDSERIIRVLSNLLGNAVKFTPRGGKITVSAQADGRFVTFSVTDTGPGIPEDQQAYLFRRYWQARKTAQLGTGLGLSIAKGIIESHGGQIWVKSHIGAGSTFCFTLPAS